MLSSRFNAIAARYALPVLCAAMLLATSAGLSAAEASKPAEASRPESAAQALVELLGSPRYEQREKAAEALRAMKRGAIEALQDALGDEDPEISFRAANLLVDLRGRGFMGVLLEELTDGRTWHEIVLAEQQGNDPQPPGEAAREGKFLPPPDLLAKQVQRGLNRPADVGGIKDGDRFVSVAGKPINGLLDLLRAVIFAGPARKVAVVVEREGKKLTLAVDLMCNPDDQPPVDLMAGAQKPQVKPKPEGETEEAAAEEPGEDEPKE